MPQRATSRVKEAVLPFDALRRRRHGARAGDEEHRRGHGRRRRLPDRVRQGPGGGRRSTCRTTGTVFITVTDNDKAAATQLATRFCDLGFQIVATGGTAQAISRMGVPVERSTRSRRARRTSSTTSSAARSTSSINTPTGSRRPHRRLRDPQRRDPQGHPLHHDDDRGDGRGAGDRRLAGRRRGRRCGAFRSCTRTPRGRAAERA